MSVLLRASRAGVATWLRGASQVRALATAAPEVSVASKPVLEKEFLIYRWNPESPDAPTYQSYKVDINAYVGHGAGGSNVKQMFERKEAL
ncbi:hypothetical protein H632_c965p0 [Helicosporidium sp. ATCC 50920]|nr:hypothetical protein H632_c965p0 [Helicosporidium sp. ATCC 50920]|eukprot:KDD74953.1 hypothetical protein H632_c965p0 [Helicosporidium sp. ATCC 50920]